MPHNPNRPTPIKYERACRERIRSLRALIEAESPERVYMGETAYQEFLDWMKWAERPVKQIDCAIPFEGTAVALKDSLPANDMEVGTAKPHKARGKLKETADAESA